MLFQNINLTMMAAFAAAIENAGANVPKLVKDTVNSAKAELARESLRATHYELARKQAAAQEAAEKAADALLVAEQAANRAALAGAFVASNGVVVAKGEAVKAVAEAVKAVDAYNSLAAAARKAYGRAYGSFARNAILAVINRRAQAQAVVAVLGGFAA